MDNPDGHREGLEAIAARIEEFEASASRANTGTGSRREGDQFEALLGTFWAALGSCATAAGAEPSEVVECRWPGGRGHWRSHTKGDRTLWLPVRAGHGRKADERIREWLRLVFPVSELVDAFPGRREVVERYSPVHGPYAGQDYPGMYSGLTTGFDDSILMVEGGVLREKMLLEYKTGKSSKGRSIDGNAHERLSFQVMQYLEAATRYTKCSLVVMANGAFTRYRNKYHVNFNIQADRLQNFAWFSMQYLCTRERYLRFADDLLGWVTRG
jgi:hypothetical protein